MSAVGLCFLMLMATVYGQMGSGMGKDSKPLDTCSGDKTAKEAGTKMAQNFCKADSKITDNDKKAEFENCMSDSLQASAPMCLSTYPTPPGPPPGGSGTSSSDQKIPNIANDLCKSDGNVKDTKDQSEAAKKFVCCLGTKATDQQKMSDPTKSCQQKLGKN